MQDKRKTRRDRRRVKLFHKISIKSKFLMMILGIAIVSIAVVGFQGLNYGQKLLTNNMYNHLISLRSAKRQQIENYFEDKQNLIKTFSVQKGISDAMGEFSSAFNLLDIYDASIDKNSSKKLINFYKDIYINRLNKYSTKEYSYMTMVPKKEVSKYLQYNYIINNPFEIGHKDLMMNASDKSYYAEVHQKYHKILRDIVKNQGFYDLFLIDIKNMYIVYSVYKETDFATNLESGPYSQSSLAKIVQKIQANPDKGVVLISDFKNYKPSYNFPQAFFATPIYENSTLVGVLAVQINIEDINNITTGNKSWKNEGLGDSGEVYLVGRDYKMRSDSRMIIQNTTKYFKELNSTNLNPDSKKKIMTLKSTILNQEVHNEAVKLAIEGKDGTIITKNYLNKKVLSAYEPLKLDGLDLAIIAEKEIYEAEKPIRKFQNSLLISSTILATLITFYAIWLAYTFLNPINRMAKGVKDVISGKSKSRINLKRDDEFGELSNSIDNLIETINEQDNTIIEKSKSYDKLLLNILPQSIATRMKNGEKDIAENVPNVAVLFSRLHGLDHLSYHLDAKESIRLLNELINEFDNQAQEFGIEKITTIGDSYMAASGLVAPRLDYARRLVEYAMKMFKIVNQFNLKHNTKLEFSVGIDCGEVMAGIVGDHKFVYDIWGEVVNGANRISHEALAGTLRVSETVYRQLTNKEEFHKCEGGRELTYAIVPKVTHE